MTILLNNHHWFGCLYIHSFIYLRIYLFVCLFIHLFNSRESLDSLRSTDGHILSLHYDSVWRFYKQTWTKLVFRASSLVPSRVLVAWKWIEPAVFLEDTKKERKKTEYESVGFFGKAIEITDLGKCIACLFQGPSLLQSALLLWWIQARRSSWRAVALHRRL